MTPRSLIYASATVVLSACATSSNTASPASATNASPMTFFVTSVGSGNGANLGGLEGADKHCQDLANAAGAGGRTWHAYLSTTGSGSVNARDRIGKGPWRNYAGTVIAQSVDDLHGASNNINKQTALTEKGGMVKGRGDTPNQHDILTGSTGEGRASTDSTDTTCGNWTSNDQGAAIVGHVDRMGLNESPPMKSWNSSHPSRGCSQDNLVGTGGAGYFYCFAVN